MRKWLRRYRADFIIACIGLGAMLLLFGLEIWLYRYSSYWEGRGYVPHGGWFFLVALSPVIGLPFLVVFGIRLFSRIKKDSAVASLARILLGIGFVVAPSPVCFGGLATATSLTMPQESGMVRFSKGFRDRIDKRCSPEEVRGWVESFLKEHGQDWATFTLPENQIPGFVKKIYPISPLQKYVRGSIEDGVVEVFWGSPLPGHWGLVVGPQGMMREEGLHDDEGETVCFLKWKAGIYVWHTEN